MKSRNTYIRWQVVYLIPKDLRDKECKEIENPTFSYRVSKFLLAAITIFVYLIYTLLL